jgi:hypothetical protein
MAFRPTWRSAESGAARTQARVRRRDKQEDKDDRRGPIVSDSEQREAERVVLGQMAGWAVGRRDDTQKSGGVRGASSDFRLTGRTVKLGQKNEKGGMEKRKGLLFSKGEQTIKFKYKFEFI